MSKKLVIVGGVAAGATAAARARRLDESAEITIVERGPYVSFANCGLPYRIAGDIRKRSSLLMQTPEGFLARYRVQVLLGTEAIGVDRAARILKIKDKNGERELPYDALILAQGGTPVLPPIGGADSPNVFRLWTIPDMDAIETYLTEAKPETALVIGGGFIGLEATEAFLKRGLATSLVELTDHLMPPADRDFGALIEKAFTEAGARVQTGRSVVAIDSKAKTATLDDGSIISAGIVLISAGVRPNTELAKVAGLEIGKSGGLVVDEYLGTADPAIWAAGDMLEIRRLVDGKKVRVPLAGPANRQGRIAATNALGGRQKYPGALGTSVFKAVDYTFAMTGLSEKAAGEAGYEVGSTVIHKGNHVSYMPGYEEISLKLVYDRKDGRILGAEAFGKADVEKRVDVIATALLGKLGVGDLAGLDLAYAPPYNSANDILNMAAFAAENDLSGYSPLVTAAEAVRAIAAAEALVLDVRTYGEYDKGRAVGSLHIPLDELRDRLAELPKDRDILIVSKAGFEGHLANRLLRQSGYSRVRYVSGGMTSLRLEAAFKEEVEA